MHENTSISVAMATFNGAAYLGEQLASIDAQQVTPMEIVISDDCSTDETMRLLEEGAAGASIPRQILRGTQRVGVIENFTKAFRACSGDTYCYCDQDDVWDRRRLAILTRALETPGVVLAFHPSRLMSADLATCNGISPAGIRAGTYQQPLPGGRLWGYGHQMVFKSSVWTLLDRILNTGQSPKPDFAANLDIMLIAAAGILGDIAYIPEPLVDFRRHDRSTSPAGKEVPRSETLADRIERQRVQVGAQLDSLSSWATYLALGESQHLLDGLVPGPTAHFARYLRKVRAHEDILRRRLRIYERRGAAGRFVALMSAAARGAYGNVYHGKLPAKLVVGDIAAALLAGGHLV